MVLSEQKLRALVVDDSAINRRTLTALIEEHAGAEVVGTAADGDEALRLTHSLSPDLITLDLQMPRMDGFTFLRLLMASRPTPVVVVSSHSGRENVFKALELGAIDFVAKPRQVLAGDTDQFAAELRGMISVVRQLVPANWHRGGLGQGRPRSAMPLARARESLPFGRPYAINTPSTAVPAVGPPAPVAPVTSFSPRVSAAPPGKLVVVASSTGGPTALLELFSRLPSGSPAAVVVAQHMPERFTRTFAERLNRLSAFAVSEAVDGQVIKAGTALVCPGGRCVEVQQVDGQLVAQVVWPDATDRYAPSADRLFTSAAQAAGERVLGVVLTGMGDDGAHGVVDIHGAGGISVVESVETAVVYGMPGAAERTGKVSDVLPLGSLVDRVVEMLA